MNNTRPPPLSALDPFAAGLLAGAGVRQFRIARHARHRGVAGRHGIVVLSGSRCIRLGRDREMGMGRADCG